MAAAYVALRPADQASRRTRKVTYDQVRGKAAMNAKKGNLVGGMGDGGQPRAVRTEQPFDGAAE